jgi:hypothetical protein
MARKVERRETAAVERDAARASAQANARLSGQERLVLALQVAAGNRATTRLLQGRREGLGTAGPSARNMEAAAQQAEPAEVRREAAGRPNATGIPDRLKSGIESLSGVAMDNVRVRFGSSRPAELGAEAYAEGEEIHIGPGFERHLPHEAWHVVQQAQGRARPTGQAERGRPISEDSGLEHEADVMGARALQEQSTPGMAVHRPPTARTGGATAVVQAKGRLALLEQPKAPHPTAEDQIAQMDAGSEVDVYLTRGVTPTQKKYLDKEMIRGSFVSFEKMLAKPGEQPPPTVAAPAKTHADAYVAQAFSADVEKLIEFSTKTDIAKTFGTEARYGYVFTIRIKRKYLTKGATGSESGWIADQNAPFDIVYIERTDRIEKNTVSLSASEFEQAVEKERIAEYLLKVQTPETKETYFRAFTDVLAKKQEIERLAKYTKAVAEETKAERSQLEKRNV